MLIRKIWLGAMLAALLPATGASAAAQTYTGDAIRMTVSDRGGPNIAVKPSTLVPNSYVGQYYGGSSWATTVWVEGVAYSTGYIAATLVTPVSNTLTATAAGADIVTVVNLGATGLRLTQTLSYANGTRFVSKRWELANTSGTARANIRVYHGGDTYFGGIDSAQAFYDPAKSMVYVRNTDYTNWGLMGFYANPATPASAYFAGNYYTGYRYAQLGNPLPDQVDPNYTDAGYYLQWDRAALAPGESWTIEATEVWTPGGGLQVLAPSNQNVASGSTVTLPFTVQNLSASTVTVDLAASSGSPAFAASLPGGPTLTVGPNAAAAVNVTVAVAPGASGSAPVTLTATSGMPVSSQVTLNVVNLALSLSADAIDFGSVTLGTPAAPQPVTILNTGSVAVTLGALSAPAPYGTANDACSSATLAPGASCAVDATFLPVTGGTFAATLNIPVVSPVLLTRTVALSGTGVAVTSGACGPSHAQRLATAPANGLCTTGSASAVASAAGAFTWSCAGTGGGATASCEAPRTYIVTPSASANGSITQASPQAIAYGDAAVFTITPAPGYSPALGGTCGGTLAGATFTTNAITADCTVTAAFAWVPIAQAIVFPAIGNHALDEPPIALNVAATSSLPVTLVSLTPAACRVSGAMLTLAGAGACTVRATQAGDALWAPAPPVDVSFEVLRVAARVAIATSPNPARVNRPVRITATVSGGLGATEGVARFRVDGIELPDCGGVTVLAGVAECTTREIPAGVRAISVEYEGDARNAGATSDAVSQYMKAYLRESFRDFDADGRSDVVLRRPDGATILRPVTGFGTGKYIELLPAGTPWQVTHSGDFHGNARASLVLRSGDGAVSIATYDALHHASVQAVAFAAAALEVLHVGDFDGDGRDDLLVRDATGRLEMRLRDAAGNGVTKRLSAAASSMALVLAADFDGDGRDDLLLAEGDRLFLLRMTDAESATPLPVEASALDVVLAGDFDGEARAGLLLRGADGRLSIWRDGTGTGTLREVSGPTAWRPVRAGDFDGDGIDDLVMADGEGRIAVWILQGAHAGTKTVLQGPSPYRVIAVGDFNGDGLADLLLAGPGNAMFAWNMRGDTVAGSWPVQGESDWAPLP